MMEKRRQGTAEFPMHPGIDEEREIAAEKAAGRGMMTAEQFLRQQPWAKNAKLEYSYALTGKEIVKLLDAHAASQLAEKEREIERLKSLVMSLRPSTLEARAEAAEQRVAKLSEEFEAQRLARLAAEQRLQEAQAFVCASLGIDHDEEAGYTIIAEPEPIEAGDTFEEAIGEYVQFTNKCDAELRERLRQREAELEQAVSALREVHDGHTRSLSSGTGKITVCTCRICSVLPSPPKEAKS